MPRGVPGSGTAGTKTREKKPQAQGNRRLITTGLIQADAVPALAKITDHGAQLFGEATLTTCNTLIATKQWGVVSGTDFMNLVAQNYDSMSHRAT